MFERALNLEYKSKGITVQSLCPFEVATKLLNSLRNTHVASDFFTPDSDSYVSQAIKTIGTQSVTNGCLAHNIKVGYINFYFNFQWHLSMLTCLN